MKLVEMKLDKDEQKKESDIAYEKPLYPWGLSLELNDDALDKLGLKDLPAVGDTKTLTARVCVTTVSSNASEGGESRRMSLQVEALALSDDVDADASDPADKLYAK